MPLLFVVVVATVVVPFSSVTVTLDRPEFAPSTVKEPSESTKTVPEIVVVAVAE